MSTNRILFYLGCIILVLVLFIAVVAASQGPGWESTNQLQDHENGLTQRAAINAAIVGGVLRGASSGDIQLVLNPPNSNNWLRSLVLIGASLGLLFAMCVLAYLIFVNRKTIAAQLSSFAAVPQPVPVDNSKQ